MIHVHLMRTKLPFILIGAALLLAGLTSFAMASQPQGDQSSCYGSCPTLTQFSLSSRTVVYGGEGSEVFHATVRLKVAGAPGFPGGIVTVKQALGPLTLCTIRLVRGQGSCSPSSGELPPRGAPYWIHASYNGDATLSASTSQPPQSLTVVP
jgi:hypothetical protein